MNNLKIIVFGIIILSPLLVNGCNQARIYKKSIADCFKNSDCPPGSICSNNTCIVTYAEQNANNFQKKYVAFNDYYLTYLLPDNETSMVLLLKNGRKKPQYCAILGIIASELRKYKNINVISQEDITSFLKIQAQKTAFDSEEITENHIKNILSQYNTTLYIEAGINIFDNNIDVVLKLFNFDEKKVLCIARKTYFSKINMDSNIDLLIRELLSSNDEKG